MMNGESKLTLYGIFDEQKINYVDNQEDDIEA